MKLMLTDSAIINYTVKNQASCEIFVGNFTPGAVLGEIDSCLGSRKFFVLDDCLQSLYPCLFEDWIYPTFFLKGGEGAKTIDIAMEICDFLASNQAMRNDVLVVVGGGTLGDVAGFAASLYKRGISWYFVPTTLLSQVDSSIGGKVAVNREQGKNLIGAFWLPKKVWITTEFLSSLPCDQYAAGMAEVIKIAVIENEVLWESLQLGSKEDTIASFIIYAIKSKLKIIENDLFEEKDGIRASLNFGHTMGHALEKTDPSLLHGQAVALGMLVELKIAEKLGYEVFSWLLLSECFKKHGLPVDYIKYLKKDYICQLIMYMINDKKNETGLISFRVPVSQGKINKILVSPSKLKDILISMKF